MLRRFLCRIGGQAVQQAADNGGQDQICAVQLFELFFEMADAESEFFHNGFGVQLSEWRIIYPLGYNPLFSVRPHGANGRDFSIQTRSSRYRMEKYIQNTLVYTLADGGDTPAKTEQETVLPPQSAGGKMAGTADWETKLLRRQQERGSRRAAAAETQSGGGETADFDYSTVLASARSRKLDTEQQQQVHQTYLKHWQQQHNEQAAKVSSGKTDVLFEDDWYELRKTPPVVKPSVEPVDNVTVLISSNRAQAVAGKGVLERLQALDGHARAEGSAETAAENRPAGHEGESPAAMDLATAEKIVLLNVYEPMPQTRNQVVCLDEEVLRAYLNNKLQPLLAEMVASEIRFYMQRSVKKMVDEWQETLLARIPQLVDDTLERSLADVMKTIKKEQRQSGVFYGQDDEV